MADEGIVNLEDDAPPPAPAPPAATPPAEPTAAVAAPPEPDEDLPDQVEGLIAALRAERAEKKTLKAAAERATQLEQELHQSRPYVDFIKQHPELTRPQQAAPPQQPVDDPDALEAAQLMDFYTADGKPDVAKGAKHLAMVRKQANQIAQQQMAPVAQTIAQQQSQQNLLTILNTPGANGVKPDPGIVRELWSRLPAQNTANEGVAWGIHAMAVGFTKPGAPAVVPPAGPPVVTEGSGGHPKTKPSLSAIERAVAANKGMDEAKFAKLSANFVPGRTTTLEDE